MQIKCPHCGSWFTKRFYYENDTTPYARALCGDCDLWTRWLMLGIAAVSVNDADPS